MKPGYMGYIEATYYGNSGDPVLTLIEGDQELFNDSMYYEPIGAYPAVCPNSISDQNTFGGELIPVNTVNGNTIIDGCSFKGFMGIIEPSNCMLNNNSNEPCYEPFHFNEPGNYYSYDLNEEGIIDCPYGTQPSGEQGMGCVYDNDNNNNCQGTLYKSGCINEPGFKGFVELKDFCSPEPEPTNLTIMCSGNQFYEPQNYYISTVEPAECPNYTSGTPPGGCLLEPGYMGIVQQTTCTLNDGPDQPCTEVYHYETDEYFYDLGLIEPATCPPNSYGQVPCDDTTNCNHRNSDCMPEPGFISNITPTTCTITDEPCYEPSNYNEPQNFYGGELTIQCPEQTFIDDDNNNEPYNCEFYKGYSGKYKFTSCTINGDDCTEDDEYNEPQNYSTYLFGPEPADCPDNSTIKNSGSNEDRVCENEPGYYGYIEWVPGTDINEPVSYIYGKEPGSWHQPEPVPCSELESYSYEPNQGSEPISAYGYIWSGCTFEPGKYIDVEPTLCILNDDPNEPCNDPSQYNEPQNFFKIAYSNNGPISCPIGMSEVDSSLGFSGGCQPEPGYLITEFSLSSESPYYSYYYGEDQINFNYNEPNWWDHNNQESNNWCFNQEPGCTPTGTAIKMPCPTSVSHP